MGKRIQLVNFTNRQFAWSGLMQAGCLASLLMAGTALAQNADPATPSAPVAPASSTAPAAPAAPATTTPRPVVLVEPAPDALAARYPSGTIQSAETANKALLEVEQQRNALDQKYAAEQHDCYEKFFATSCLDAAKERHRLGTAQVRKVEVEANAFIRSDRVVQRDKRLAEKRASDAANPPKPLADLPLKPVVPNDAADKEKEHQQHIADHEAKEQQRKQDEINSAPQRAANVDAYNKKVQDAIARQSDVAKKKEEKAKQAAAKAAAASKASDSATSKVGVVPAASPSDSSTSAPAASKP